ncbi:MAG TPA: NrfD/PsrC family molybdoenzyme membrane anchor subunit [Solirubrobacteraceae bacterium]|nr:NrfD/PsrC family molybdoenzyme membrane anchor subunit [Solirubrobacteraceae bacterium]
MSDAEVTRDGLTGVRPGREAQMRAGDGRRRRDAPRADHPGDSYYGRPIINPPVWAERDIAGYLFAGGLAGSSSILAAGAELTGRRRLARRSKLAAAAALAASLAALVHDLGRPERFLNMLRVFKPTSPMNMGSWLLSVYGPVMGAAAASDLLGVAPRAGRAATVGAGVLGAGVSTYTAALIADTAVPAWHGGHRELPFLFAGSAAAAGSGFALIAAPRAESGPARRMALLGATGELLASQLLERRLGVVAETLREGSAGTRLRAAKALTGAGLIGAATLAGRSRSAAVASGACLLAGSALTRFGLFAAGMASARDPRYTVQPQRERIAARDS